MQIQPERACDFVGEEAAQGPPGRIGAADEFGFVPAQRDRVVAVAGARWPRRLLRREERGEPRGGGTGLSTHNPAWWPSSCRTVTSALPACPNSGQWSTTLSS